MGRIYQADLLINATLPEFAAVARALPAANGAKWAAWAEAGRRDYLKPTVVPGQLNLGKVIA